MKLLAPTVISSLIDSKEFLAIELAQHIDAANRFNPRQRWHEGDDHGLGWPKMGSTVAGVSLVVWGTLVGLAMDGRKPIHRDEHEQKIYGAEDKAYHKKSVAFANQLYTALKDAKALTDWVEQPLLKVRRGRGMEYTVVSRNYDDMRSFLTQAALGWYDKHPRKNDNPSLGLIVAETVEPDPYMVRVKRILDALEKSSDRRENTWDYTDKPISEIMKLPWAKSALQRRRATLESDKRFEKWFEDLLTHKRTSRVALPEALG